MKKVGQPDRGWGGGAKEVPGIQGGRGQEKTPVHRGMAPGSLEKRVFGTSSSAVDGQI